MIVFPIRNAADLGRALAPIDALRGVGVDLLEALGQCNRPSASPQPVNTRRCTAGVVALMQRLDLAEDGSDVIYTGLVFALPLPGGVAIISPLSRPEVLCTVPLAMLRPCGG